jgi:hypothetical protein
MRQQFNNMIKNTIIAFRLIMPVLLFAVLTVHRLLVPLLPVHLYTTERQQQR